MTNKQEFLIEGIVSDIANWLIEERSMTLQKALDAIYNSQFFEKLQNPSTGLCTESSAYNYDLLVSEIENGKFIQTEI
jgi:hypothetical protein